MIEEFKAFFTVFQQGKQLANATTWKNRQMAAGAIAGVLGSALVIAKGFGYAIPLDQDTVEALAGGIAAAYSAVNVVLTAATSARVGVPPKDAFPAQP